MSEPTPHRADLTWKDIAFLCEGFSFASTPLKTANQAVTSEYALGPRGAWMLMLIHSGTIYPLDIAAMFRVGRSLITAELARLAEAGLIVTRPGRADRRRTELMLTPLGVEARHRVAQQLSDLVTDRLAAYSRDEILLCARLLRDMRFGQAPSDASPAEQTPDEQTLAEQSLGEQSLNGRP